ncbi:MAG: alpha/beta fold hydrolase [Bacteroidales bacterium]|nr:alpha/beta fold hydrolase [Bacteroidales bacterium]
MALAVLVMAAGAFQASAASRVVTDSLGSKSLGCWVKYNVYLPDGYGKSEKVYPVTYLLHGLTGNYSDWMKLGNMKLVADELIGTGEASEMVIIMPNAGHEDFHHVQNGYFNIPGGYNYEDFFFDELMPCVESKYHCGGSKGYRAIMGLSMGGGGSVVYCQRHPDLFSSCYAMSAWLDQKLAENPKNPEDKMYLVSKSVREHSALDFMDGADEATLAKLRTIKWFIDCGDDDYLFDLSVKLHQKMRDAKVKSELRVRNGVHNWEYWHGSLRLALPFASRNFAPAAR